MGRCKRAIVGCCAVAGSLVLTASQLCGAESARELLDQVRQLNQTTRHWNDRVQRLSLTIVDHRGGTRERTIQVYMKRYPGDASRSVLLFNAPPEVRGIGFLQWIEPHQPDRQWLYLPELKRVRQITGSSKRESFVGTDFSYEDLSIMAEVTDWTEEDARATRLADEAVDGQGCAVLELVPTDADVAYGKIRLWLGREDLVVHKYQFDDRSGGVAKTLLASDIRVTQNVPTAFRLEMRSERSGSRTIVVFDQVDYNTGLDDALFSQRQLERGM